MSTKKRAVLYAIAVAAVLCLWSVHVVDGQVLARELEPLGAQKAATIMANAMARATTHITVETSSWRMPPVVGTPTAKVTVRIVVEMGPNNRYDQTYDYYYERRAQGWQEITHADRQPAHCH